MTAPLTSLECELLEAITHGRDPAALAVLGDYWIEHVDEARGAFVQLGIGANADRIDLADEEARLARHADRWRASLLGSGYPERDLVLVDGFLQWPVSLPADHPLDGQPDLVRISPRYYREGEVVRQGLECRLIAAEAITPRTTTRVAIKAANDDYAQDVVLHEHAILQRISHPNVVRCLGYAVRPDRRALALAWCGTDLRRLLALAREHRIVLGLDFALSCGVQLMAALEGIHAVRVMHREVRTDHVAVASDGTTRLLDFGTASCADLPRFNRYSRYISPGYPGDQRFRWSYMSREQVRGQLVDERTDVYSATVVIAELAANQHPIDLRRIETDFDLLMYIRDTQLEPAAHLPSPLRVALRMGLERDHEGRPTATAMRETLLAVARTLKLDIGPHVIARRLVELGVPT